MVMNYSFETGSRTHPLFEVRRGEPSADVLEVRLAYVQQQGWHKNEDDRDRYDGAAKTYHFSRRLDGGNISTTMRLTAIDRVEESLSFSMLAGNDSLQQQALERLPDLEDKEVWDLTRLCVSNEGKGDMATTSAQMIELFGMAQYVSSRECEEGKAPYWVFATTPGMMRFFEYNGIGVEELAKGELIDAQGDAETTSFCLVDVYGVVDFLSTSKNPVHAQTYQCLERGFREAAENADS